MSQTKAELIKGLNINASAPATSLQIDASGNVNIDSNTLYVDATNNRVGIGTTTVNSLLEVRGSTDGQNVLHLSNNAGAGDGQAENQIRVTCNGNTNWGNLDIQAYQTIFTQNGGEKARIDPNGRLLVGTSSTSATCNALLQTGSGTGGTLILAYGNTSPGNGQDLGFISFNDSSHIYNSAIIRAARDGGTWTSGTSMPTRLTFSTTANGASSPTERMRITSSGTIIFPAGSGGLALANNETAIYNDGGFGQGIRFGNTYGAGKGFCLFSTNGVEVGQIAANGTTGTSYVTTSDYRLKENVAPVHDGIARLLQLKPIRFNFIAEPDRTVDGFLAHEAQAIVPECATGEKDAVNHDGNPIYQGIDQSKLVPLLTAALQEAVARIEQLEAAVATLQGS